MMLAVAPRPQPQPGTGTRPVKIVPYTQILPAVDEHGHRVRGLRFRCRRPVTGAARCKPYWLPGAERRPVTFPKRVILDGVVFLIESK